jgi:ADP-ribosylglycohydrolase
LEVHGADQASEDIAKRFGSSGYVVEAVPMALLIAASAETNGLAALLERAVAVGGDTDTIASIVGQIVGASGVEVPQDLLQRIPRIADVESVVTQFAAMVAGPSATRR